MRLTIGHWAVLGILAPALAVGACGPPAPPEESRVTEAVASEGLLALNGTEIFVERMGSGEPVMIIHGGPMLDHGYLLPHLAPLAQSYELVFADQRVSGRSAGDVPPDSVRIATFVADIEALRLELGLGRVHMVGHSWGGHLALNYALEHGEALRSLTLLSPLAASADLWQREQQAQAAPVDADQQARQEILDSEAFAAEEPAAIEALLRLAFKNQFEDSLRAAELDLYVPQDYMARSRLFGKVMVDLTDYDLHPHLAQLDLPTLLLYGAAEPALDLGGAALHEGISGSTLVAIEAAGHFPFIEQPKEFLGAVRSFLDTVD